MKLPSTIQYSVKLSWKFQAQLRSRSNLVGRRSDTGCVTSFDLRKIAKFLAVSNNSWVRFQALGINMVDVSLCKVAQLCNGEAIRNSRFASRDQPVPTGSVEQTFDATQHYRQAFLYEFFAHGLDFFFAFISLGISFRIPKVFRSHANVHSWMIQTAGERWWKNKNLHTE